MYNCTTGAVNRLPWNLVQDMCLRNFIANPFNDVLWYPRKIFNGSRLYNDCVSTFIPFLPAHWYDAIRWISGKKPLYVLLFLVGCTSSSLTRSSKEFTNLMVFGGGLFLMKLGKLFAKSTKISASFRILLNARMAFYKSKPLDDMGCNVC